MNLQLTVFPILATTRLRCSLEYSHNRLFGENYIKGIPMNKLAEGVDTAKALVRLSELYNVELPISKAVYNVLLKTRMRKKCWTACSSEKQSLSFDYEKKIIYFHYYCLDICTVFLWARWSKFNSCAHRCFAAYTYINTFAISHS